MHAPQSSDFVIVRLHAFKKRLVPSFCLSIAISPIAKMIVMLMRSRIFIVYLRSLLKQVLLLFVIVYNVDLDLSI